MNLIESIKNLRRNKDVEKPRGQEVLSTSSEVSTWNNLISTSKDERHRVVVMNYRKLYRAGGITRTAIDTYTLFMFSPGWVLQSDDENSAVLEEIQDTFFNKRGAAQIDQVTLQMAQDALSLGDGYAKILKGRGQYQNTPVALQHIPAERVRPHINEARETQWYDLFDDKLTMIVGRIAPDEMVRVTFFPAGDYVYGVGILESAWDEIKYDIEVAEGTAAAIKRHGYGIWHAKVSSTNPEIPVSATDIEKVKESLKKISARSEIVTSSNIDIVGLNENGQGTASTYQEWSIIRLCTALGIPCELLGLRQGTTDNTAVTRIENFYKKIQTLQRTLADAINTQFIDRILTSLGRDEGTVWLEYGDPSPEDNAKRAAYVQSIAAMTPGDPFAIMSQVQMQNYLRIDHDQWVKDEGYDESHEEHLTEPAA